MAEDKPHEASASKIRRSRKEGNVAKSTELSGVFSFAAGAATVMAVIPFYYPIFRDWVTTAAMGQPVSMLPPVKMIFVSLIPFLASGMTGAIVTVIQTAGPVPKPLKFELNKLNPAQGIKKMFSMEAIVNAAKAFLTFCVALLAIRPAIQEIFSRGTIGSSIYTLAIMGQSAIAHIILLLCGIGLVFSIADFILSRMRWKKQMKMTHEEMKRDYKENNGDPLIKGRRRQLHRELLRGAPQRVKDASFVVTNPTHFAVALEYAPPRIPVPRIICRAADEGAFQVRRLAAEYDVPLVENVELARTLFARGRPGREIPEDTYVAVAEIVAALMKKEAVKA